MNSVGRIATMVVLVISAAGVGAQDRAPVYPVDVDPEKAIAAAVRSAARDGKHVLLDFGADWCPDCRVLDVQFKDPRVAALLEASYHVVRIDVGRRDKNGAVVDKYGATSGDWIPALVVLDGQGQVVGRTDAEVRVSRRTTPEELVAVLQRWVPRRQVATLGEHRQHGIRVTLALERDRQGGQWLAATYTPQQPGVHLYGASLPSTGVQGLGRPTVLRVTHTSGWTVGAVVADRVEHVDRFDALDLAVPIYPDGPVTLRVPVTIAPGASRTGRVTIGYMGCSAVGCLPPVIDRELIVRLPATASTR